MKRTSRTPKKNKEGKLLPQSKAPLLEVEGYNVVAVKHSIVGTVIGGQYEVTSFLDKGCYGEVLRVKDRTQAARKLVIKVSSDASTFKREYRALQALSASSHEHPAEQVAFPQIVMHGFLYFGLADKADFDSMFPHTDSERHDLRLRDFQEKGTLKQFIIMERMGKNIADLFCDNDLRFNKATAFDLGVRSLHLLEEVHRAGLIYNDFKMDNLMLRLGDTIKKPKPGQSLIEDCTLGLIDFGFASSFRSSSGRHLKQKQVASFRGNLRFASLNLLNFLTPSRRDDLIGLCYVLAFALDSENEKQQYRDLKGVDTKQQLKVVRKIKQLHTPEILVGSNKELLPFFKAVFKLGYEEEPDYQGLREMLRTLLLQEQAKAAVKSPPSRAHSTMVSFTDIGLNQSEQKSSTKLLTFLSPSALLSPISPNHVEAPIGIRSGDLLSLEKESVLSEEQSSSMICKAPPEEKAQRAKGSVNCCAPFSFSGMVSSVKSKLNIM